ncbi:MAG: hypothetical protein KOO62_08595 [candidate division Zixibacteria bacterium]|nr:hypothetical protein [candidate division Zixibacteria bacterium]
MKLIKTICMLGLLVAMVALYSSDLLAQTVSGLSIKPPDSAEAERVRIWVPIETTSRCRTQINIMDSAGDTVRHLINYLPKPGYYNFYWDKRDDSGHRVEAGIYPYVIENCGGEKRRREVEARFSRWELASVFTPLDTARPFWIELELLEDSALVSVRYFTHNDRLLDSLVVDSLLNRGKHEFDWSSSRRARRGNYIIKVSIGDYQYIREVTHIP